MIIMQEIVSEKFVMIKVEFWSILVYSADLFNDNIMTKNIKLSKFYLSLMLIPFNQSTLGIYFMFKN